MRHRTVASSMLVVLCAASAQAASLQSGTYALSNHPDGNAVPPPYGMRLDEMFDETGGHDRYSFDFEHADSNMVMDLNIAAGTIHIHGVVRGGRDIGSAWAADVYNAIYAVDFLYTIGNGFASPDDDYKSDGPNESNFGTITHPTLGVINLVDNNMDHALRIGDEDNDLGHRGFSGISGWGWLSIVRPNGQIFHTADQDWLFTAEFVNVPAPGAACTLGLVGLAGLRRRR